MKRPLTYMAVVFVVILTLIQIKNGRLLSQTPIIVCPDGQKTIFGVGQGESVILYGVISDYSVQNQYGQITTELILKDVKILSDNEGKSSHQIPTTVKEIQDKKVTRKGQTIVVYCDNEYCITVGSHVILTGELYFWQRATNPGEFDAEKFYGNRDVLFAVKKAEIRKVSIEGNQILQRLKEFRIRQEAYLEKYLPGGNDAIIKAMLFGNKKEIEKETKNLYQNNGIAHILAISGLHISLIGMSLYRVLLQLPLPKWFVLCFCELFLILYCFMVGFSASAFRALVMFSFFLLSKFLKRTYDMLTAMAFSAMLWLFVHPGYLFDCGFQLSYAAILGIGCILPTLQEITDSFANRWIKKFVLLFLPSLSVTLMTAPILIYHYYELSFFSIALNLIVLPLMAPLLISAVGMLLVANLWEGFCAGITVLAFPVNLILQIYELGCHLLEMLPIGRKNIAPLSPAGIIFYYSLIYVMTVLVKKKSHYYQFVIPILCFGIILVPKKLDFSVWILNVGQGDCNVIFTDDGNCFVIDCGSTSKYGVGEKILIPFLKYHGIGEVDGVFVTHPDADHMNGVIELLEFGEEENISVGGIYIYEKGPENEPGAWEELLGLSAEKDVLMYGVGQGDILQVDDMRIECLYPLNGQRGLTGNAASLVLKVECDGFRGLFTGDLEEEGEKELLREYARTEGDFDFLKVGHHGSSTSSSSAFLEWVNAGYATISCAKNSIYGHPHEETLARLDEVGITYLITYEGGVCINTGGKKQDSHQLQE